jgi:hypothetical protein
MNMFKFYSENVPTKVEQIKQTVSDKEQRKSLISDCFLGYKRWSDVMTSDLMHDICYNVHNDTANSCYIQQMQRYENDVIDKYMTRDMMTAFISQDCYLSKELLMNLPEQLWTEDMVWIVIKKHIDNILCVPDNLKTEEMIEYVIKNNGIRYVNRCIPYELNIFLIQC